MAKKKSGRVVDKWKLKKWYELIAPEMFERKVLGQTFASDEKKVVGRVVEVSLPQLMNSTNHSAMFTKVRFRVVSVDSSKANTEYAGHRMDRNYLTTIARRRTTVIDDVVDVKTKDKKKARLKLFVVADGNVSTTTKKNLRTELRKLVMEMSGGKSFEELVLGTLSSSFSSELFNNLKSITSLRRVEVRALEAGK